MSLRDRFLNIRAHRNHKTVLDALDTPIKCDAGRTPPFIGGRACKRPAELTALVHHCGRSDGQMEVILCEPHLAQLAALLGSFIDDDGRLPCGEEIFSGSDLMWNIRSLSPAGGSSR